MVREFKPRIRFCADSPELGACFGFCVSLSLCLYPACALSYSLSLKKKKKLKNNKITLYPQLEVHLGACRTPVFSPLAVISQFQGFRSLCRARYPRQAPLGPHPQVAGAAAAQTGAWEGQHLLRMHQSRHMVSPWSLRDLAKAADWEHK